MRRDTPAVALAGLLFFLSGAAALVYQVAWQRLLALHSGVGLYSVAMIVAAFMAGLGIGSHLGGRLSHARLGGGARPRRLRRARARHRRLRRGEHLALLRLALPAGRPPAEPVLAGRRCCTSPALLPPDAAHGHVAALPRAGGRDRRRGGGPAHRLALRRQRARRGGGRPRARRGCCCPPLGVRGAVLAAAARTSSSAWGPSPSSRCGPGGARGAWRRRPSAPLPDGRREAPGSRPLALWLSLYALSGFVALSLEIVWFRLLDVAVKSTAFTFGTVLAIYLLGSATGRPRSGPRLVAPRRGARCGPSCSSSARCWRSPRCRSSWSSPCRPRPRRFAWFVDYWAGYDFFPLGHAGGPRRHRPPLRRSCRCCSSSCRPSSWAVSFPILQRAVHDDPATSGRKVGALQAANIAGCTAGSLLVGLVGLQHLGTPGTLRLLLGLGLVFAARRPRGTTAAPSSSPALLLAAARRRPARARSGSGGGSTASRPGVPLAFFEEDATSVVALTPDEGGWRLSVNGKGNSWLPYGSGHTLLGAVPATVHPAPRRRGRRRPRLGRHRLGRRRGGPRRAR